MPRTDRRCRGACELRYLFSAHAVANGAARGPGAKPVDVARCGSLRWRQARSPAGSRRGAEGCAEQYQVNHADVHAAPWWPAAGFISHAGAPADGGWLVVDLWETKAALGAFMEKAATIFEANGMPRAKPKIYEASNVDIG